MREVLDKFYDVQEDRPQLAGDVGKGSWRNGLKGWGGFGQVKQKGKGIPGGRDKRNKGKAVREQWACWRNWE